MRPSCFARTRTIIASTNSGPFSPERTSILSHRDSGWLDAQTSALRNGTSRSGPAPGMATPRALALEVAHCGVAGHVQDITCFAMTQRGAELGGPAKLVVTDDPAVGQARQAAIQEIERDLPLLLERDVQRHMAFLASRLVVSPVLGKVEPPVEGSVTRLRRVGQEHPNLAIVDLAEPDTTDDRLRRTQSPSWGTRWGR